MATSLDHRHFRETNDILTHLHDEWMHNSTGTSNTTQGQYNGQSGPGMHPSMITLPPHQTASTLGFSPGDMRAFMTSIPPGTSDTPIGGPTLPGAIKGSILNPLATGHTGNGGTSCGPGQCDKGGGICGSGCACCKNQTDENNCINGLGTCDAQGNYTSYGSGGSGGGGGSGGRMHGGKGGGGSKQHGRGGGGGTKAQGAKGLGGYPKLGNVPFSPQASSGTSPIMLLLILGGGGVLIYFIWHKLRKSRAEDKEMEKKGE